MTSMKMIALLREQAEGLTQQALQTVIMNPRTPSLRTVPRTEVAERIAAIYGHLASWLAKPDDDAVRTAYEDWGRKRFTQKVPISELVYGVLLAKENLRHHAGDPARTDLHESEGAIGDFFDRALYYLVRGYEMQGAAPASAGRDSGPIAHPR